MRAGQTFKSAIELEKDKIKINNRRCKQLFIAQRKTQNRQKEKKIKKHELKMQIRKIK